MGGMLGGASGGSLPRGLRGGRGCNGGRCRLLCQLGHGLTLLAWVRSGGRVPAPRRAACLSEGERSPCRGKVQQNQGFGSPARAGFQTRTLPGIALSSRVTPLSSFNPPLSSSARGKLGRDRPKRGRERTKTGDDRAKRGESRGKRGEWRTKRGRTAAEDPESGRMERSGGAGAPSGAARRFSGGRLEPDLPADRPPRVAGFLLWAAGFPPGPADVPFRAAGFPPRTASFLFGVAGFPPRVADVPIRMADFPLGPARPPPGVKVLPPPPADCPPDPKEALKTPADGSARHQLPANLLQILPPAGDPTFQGPSIPHPCRPTGVLEC